MTPILPPGKAKALGLAKSATPDQIIQEMYRRMAAGDRSVVPKVKGPMTSDYWKKDGDRWIREHVGWRRGLCDPCLVSGGPVSAGAPLLPRRTTEVLYEGESVEDTIEDCWDEAEAARVLERRWKLFLLPFRLS